jgi:hypothetical protein
MLFYILHQLPYSLREVFRMSVTTQNTRARFIHLSYWYAYYWRSELNLSWELIIWLNVIVGGGGGETWERTVMNSVFF